MGDKPRKRDTRKKTPGPRASTTGGPGPRKVDQSSWRKRMKTSRIKFDDDAKERFLQGYAEHGRMHDGAVAAGVTYSCVKNHLDNDPEFMQAFLEAKQAYRDRFLRHVQKMMFEGVEEPIIGGQFKDEVVAYKRVYPTNLIAMEMRRVEPEYKERTEVDMNVQGGVLVVPARMSTEEWMAKFGRPRPDGEG